jgi:hypothetical protein
MDNRPD